jgi:hypothetical protein
MKDFMDDGSMWTFKALAEAVFECKIPDPNNTCRDLNLVFTLARACMNKDAADRKEQVEFILNHALFNVARGTDDKGTLQFIEVLNDIRYMVRQHDYPMMAPNASDLLEICMYESDNIVAFRGEPNDAMLNRFVWNWLDWQYASLFEDNQDMAEARELICEQIKTGDVNKVLAACMKLVLVTADVSGNDESDDLVCQALDCMFCVQELAKTLAEHYPIIMSNK